MGKNDSIMAFCKREDFSDCRNHNFYYSTWKMPHASLDRQKLCLVVCTCSNELPGYWVLNLHTLSIVKSVLHNFNHDCYWQIKMNRHILNKTTTAKLSHDYKNGEFWG